MLAVVLFIFVFSFVSILKPKSKSTFSAKEIRLKICPKVTDKISDNLMAEVAYAFSEACDSQPKQEIIRVCSLEIHNAKVTNCKLFQSKKGKQLTGGAYEARYRKLVKKGVLI